MPDGRGRASETRTRRANDVVAPRGGLDLVLSVDDDASDASVFEAEGKREEDAGAWDDVLEALTRTAREDSRATVSTSTNC